jgi:hypothetical protein
LAVYSIIIPNKVIAAWALNHLTPEYEQTVAIISQTFRAREGEINTKELFSQLLDESRRLKSKKGKETALVAKASSKKAQTRPKCSHCHKSGHNKSKYWQKYPEKKPKKPNSAGNTQNEDFSLIMSAETALFNQNDESISNWILDSAATRHICCDRDLFTKIEPYKVPLN